MRVAIVHHHLRRGGVTRVIESAVAALAESDVRVIVFTGEAATSPLHGAAVHLLPGLKYADDLAVAHPASSLVDAMRQAARSALGGPPDVWHVHNHSLGKNPSVTDAARLLAEGGDRLLLQIHDFPEDGRPANYRCLIDVLGEGDPDGLERKLYPSASHVHYATLNGRDRAFLAAAGVSCANLHLLPNPAYLPPIDSEGSPNQPAKLILYPTRAIRRKNIGEFILWSSAALADERYAVTMAPENPSARPVYDRWVDFSMSRTLPVEFEIGRRYAGSFPALLRSAHTVATTSVAEGFGLAYLEPWLAGRPVRGRDLQEITVDFADAGLDLSRLYARMDVPAEWVDLNSLRKRLGAALARARQAYGRTTDDNDVDEALDAAVRGDRVDFGRLDEALQEQVIDRARDDATFQRELRQCVFGSDADQTARCSRNRAVVEAAFGLAGYGRRLRDVYRAVAGSDTGRLDFLPGREILEMFLDPSRFCLLRT